MEVFKQQTEMIRPGFEKNQSSNIYLGHGQERDSKNMEQARLGIPRLDGRWGYSQGIWEVRLIK